MMLLHLLSVFLLITTIDGRTGDECDILSIERKAELDKDSLCVLDARNCGIVLCSNNEQEIKSSLSSDEQYFAAFVLGSEQDEARDAGDAVRAETYAVNDEDLDTWKPMKTVWIMGYSSFKRPALVDSGAFAVVLPFKFGDYLQYEVAKDEVLHTAYGVNSTIGGYWRYVDIEIDDEEYEKIPALWCAKDHDSREILLGRREFFELFIIVIDKKENMVEFIPKDPEKNKLYWKKKQNKKIASLKLEL